jgi:hypothetical protein
VQAPRAAGVVGFLQEAGGEFDLGDVVLESTNEYAAVSIVSMDEEPLNKCGQVLVQVGTIVRPTGWAQRPTTLMEDGEIVQGYEIIRTGYPPYMVKDTHVKLRVRNPSLTRAMRLDSNGYAVQSVPVIQKDGWAELTLPRKTMHLILQ